MPHIPNHPDNKPGVYKPNYKSLALNAGILLENEPYVPINTQSLLELFQLGFTKETLSDFMGKDINDKSVTEAYSRIMGKVQKGDAPGGLVGYSFPETVLGDEETVEETDDKLIKTATGGEYVNSLLYMADELRKNPPFPPVMIDKGDGTTDYGFNVERGGEEEKQIMDWITKIQDLQDKNVESAVPDTFNIYATPFDRYRGERYKQENLIEASLHEPLHAYFDHQESSERGFSQEEYHNFTNKMKSNILDNMRRKGGFGFTPSLTSILSEEQLIDLLYHLLIEDE